MRIPAVSLEGKPLLRIILSVRPEASSPRPEILSLLKEAYAMGFLHFDLPSPKHLEAFRELLNLTEDEQLTGFCRLDAKEGVSFLGRPLQGFESKMIATLRKNLPPEIVRDLSLPAPSTDVFTQKEIDRFAFDPHRFDRILSSFHPEETPFLILGEKYGDWLLALGRFDLLQSMVAGARAKGFIPLFSGQWATFSLPKAKPLEVAAYAVPINRGRSFPDLARCSDVIKRFDKPVISLNPLANGELLSEAETAFAFLFDELKIYAAITDVASEKEVRRIQDGLVRSSSFSLPRKA
jgi:hypothetical protein